MDLSQLLKFGVFFLEFSFFLQRVLLKKNGFIKYSKNVSSLHQTLALFSHWNAHAPTEQVQKDTVKPAFSLHIFFCLHPRAALCRNRLLQILLILLSLSIKKIPTRKQVFLHLSALAALCCNRLLPLKMLKSEWWKSFLPTCQVSVVRFHQWCRRARWCRARAPSLPVYIWSRSGAAHWRLALAYIGSRSGAGAGIYRVEVCGCPLESGAPSSNEQPRGPDLDPTYASSRLQWAIPDRDHK